VAVKFLEDSPELRRLRRNTWPENPSARREMMEAAAREQQQQQQSSLARALELLQEPAKLFDLEGQIEGAAAGTTAAAAWHSAGCLEGPAAAAAGSSSRRH